MSKSRLGPLLLAGAAVAAAGAAVAVAYVASYVAGEDEQKASPVQTTDAEASAAVPVSVPGSGAASEVDAEVVRVHARRPRSSSSRPPAPLSDLTRAAVAKWCDKATEHGRNWILSAVADGLPLGELIAIYPRLCHRAPASTKRDIEQDIPRTRPKDPQYAEGSPRRAQLQEVLYAAANEHRRGYTQGMNFLAAQLLEHMPPEPAFALLIHLLTNARIGLCHVYAPRLPGVEVASKHLEVLCAVHCPRLASHLKAVNFDFRFIMDWYFCLFTTLLPERVLDDVWDVVFANGWMGVLYVVVALLKIGEPVVAGAPPASAAGSASGGESRDGAGSGGGSSLGRLLAAGAAFGAGRAAGADGAAPPSRDALDFEGTYNFYKSLAGNRDVEHGKEPEGTLVAPDDLGAAAVALMFDNEGML